MYICIWYFCLLCSRIVSLQSSTTTNKACSDYRHTLRTGMYVYRHPPHRPPRALSRSWTLNRDNTPARWSPGWVVTDTISKRSFLFYLARFPLFYLSLPISSSLFHSSMYLLPPLSRSYTIPFFSPPTSPPLLLSPTIVLIFSPPFERVWIATIINNSMYVQVVSVVHTYIHAGIALPTLPTLLLR